MEEFLGAFKAGKLYDDEPAFLGFALESNYFAATDDKLSAVARNDLRCRLGILGILFPISHLDARDNVSRHRDSLPKFSPFYIAHIAGFSKYQVHAEGGAQGLRRVGVSSHGDVVSQNASIFGVGAVLDNCFGAFRGTFAAQIGHTLFGD